jgi:hypothetical protein
MAIRTIIFFLLTTLLLSCNTTNDNKQKEQKFKENIIGDWERLYEKDNSNDIPPPPSFVLPQGMTISNDSIEFYLGFFKDDNDSITGKRTRQYLGNCVPYKTNKDSIYYKNPLTENWEFKWKYIRRQQDTLELAINDTMVIKYKKLTYKLDELTDFDQIVYSSSGCYGSCPMIDISVAKNGYVLFQGEGYVKPIGFFTTIIDKKTSENIFEKFRKANPLQLLDEYAVGHTDDQSLTTTFIKNGKIVKTIHDYGTAAPKELIWAYIPISNIHNSIKLDSLPLDETFYPKLHYFTFKKDNLILPLEKSESFYLWTELKKSKQTEKQINAKYKLTFSGNYTYLRPDPNKERQHKYEIKSVTTDGQFYKFIFKGEKSITYDLGYNFIDSNFKSTDFRKPNETTKTKIIM